MNHSDFKHKSIEEVYITQIVSPDKFFVRKVISQKHIFIDITNPHLVDIIESYWKQQ